MDLPLREYASRGQFLHAYRQDCLCTLHHRRNIQAGGYTGEGSNRGRRWCARRQGLAGWLVLISERGKVVAKTPYGSCEG